MKRKENENGEFLSKKKWILQNEENNTTNSG
jgi:hypothetical protein